MDHEVFTLEWSRACCDALNARDSYRTAAADWSEAVVLVMSADPGRGVPEDRAVYLDLHQGRCRGARLANEVDRASAPVVFRADPGAWRELLDGGLDPVAAVMRGYLRLEQGSLFALAKHSAAAREMLGAAAAAGGTFPAPPG